VLQDAFSREELVALFSMVVLTSSLGKSSQEVEASTLIILVDSILDACSRLSSNAS
jgi:hypothetical protein